MGFMRRKSEDHVDQAMTAISRRDFLPAEIRELAEEDQALPIGCDQTNSQPRTVANMLRLLDARPGDAVLDVGAGSGWSTALLGHLVGESGRVIGVELEPELTARAQQILGSYAMGWTEVRQAEPGVLGAPQDAPFDRILVSAEAESLPEQLVEQLSDDGVMVVPVRSEMLRLTRRDGEISATRHGPYSFVPLR